MILGNFLQDVKNFRWAPVKHVFGAFDVRGDASCNHLTEDKRFEHFEGHIFRKPALSELELWAYNNDTSSRIIHSLTQKVLPKPALFTAEHVTQGS